MAKASQAVRDAVAEILGGADPRSLDATGRDLLGIAGVLAGHPRLRAALTDPALAVEAKRGLAEEVFGGRAAPGAVDVLVGVPEHQRLRPRALVDVLEEVAYQAMMDGADARGQLARVQDELFSFARVLERDAALRAALTDPALPGERCRAVVAELLAGKAYPATAAIVEHVVGAGRAAELARIVREIVEEAAERRLAVVAEVRSAVPIDDERRERLAAALGEMTGRRVDLQVVIDPSVVGSLSVRIGDEVYDGTVKRQLELAGEYLGAA